MAFKFTRTRRRMVVPAPSQPQIAGEATEPLTGMVNGMTASANEEYMAMALKSAKMNFMFRYVVGAPKGLPGWKELDFLILDNGVVYLMEMDTAFTHRTKEQKDILHDALLVNDPNLKTLGTIWPTVTHVDGDTDSSSKESARAFIRKRFGK
jgi:hypothetical protein